MKCVYEKAAMSAAALLALLVVIPVHASYVCTGNAGSAAVNPYFDGDLTDARCDTDEIETALGGITIDTNFIVGSKSNSVGEDPITSWGQDEFGLGTLTVTDTSDTSGSWTLTGSSTTPLFFVDKYDGGYDVFTYMGPGTDPFSDSWDDTNRGVTGANCSEVNCNATTSHISVYGVVPIPGAVWLFGTGLLGLVGMARRKKTT